MAIFFSDPDPQQAADEEQQILSNASYGATEDEREQNLTRAKNYALGYRIAGAGALVCAYIVLMAHSNMIMYLVLMAFPIVGILLMRSGNGLITLLGSKNTGYASAETGFAGPIFGLAFFAFKQYDFIDISQLIIPGVVIGAAFFYVVYSYTLKRLKVELKLQIAIALLFAAAYGFGSAAVVNCVFDQTKPQYYVSEITN
ncbi:MAG TPA: hypothetical protein VHS53_05190, partial [Mucilaginibacter sp.]|nr:hypothetical protein [Mucilaginibacter sp.]